MFVKNHLYNSDVHNSKGKYYCNAKPSAYYLYIETNVSVDFQIYISEPLISHLIIVFYVLHIIIISIITIAPLRNQTILATPAIIVSAIHCTSQSFLTMKSPMLISTLTVLETKMCGKVMEITSYFKDCI